MACWSFQPETSNQGACIHRAHDQQESTALRRCARHTISTCTQQLAAASGGAGQRSTGATVGRHACSRCSSRADAPSLSLFPAVLCCAGLAAVAPQDNQPAAAPMSDGEQGELLRHLKVKWASVNVEYQKLGFVMDIGEQQGFKA